MRQMYQKGFTLIEIVIAVVALIILSSWSVKTYSRFIERTRAAEVDNTINLATTAQGRYLMRYGRYSTKWTSLDAPQLSAYLKQVGEYVSPDGKYYITRGGGIDNPKSGYKIYFEEIFGKYFIVAERMHWRYGYTLVRPLPGDRTYCLPMTKKQIDVDFCLDFMNVESEEQLPGDPRLGGY